MQVAMESVESEDAENDEGNMKDILDIGDVIDGGDVGSIAEGDTEEDQEMEDSIMGNNFVEEVAMELEGLRM